MPTLYHMPIAICAQKVRVCLAEKGVVWDGQDVTEKLRSPEYLKLNPAGYVPTLVHEGEVVTESRVISEYIDEPFDGPTLQSSDAYRRSVMRRWTKQAQRKSMPLDPLKADRMANMLKDGWNSPYLVMALRRFEKLACDMEAALDTSTWLAGDDYSLADADYTPYLQRMEDLGLEWLWASRPALKDWYDRVRSRPSFAAVVSDWIAPEARQAVAAQSREIGPRFQQALVAAQ